MAKSVDKVKLGLKLKAQAKEGALTLRLGTKKHVLPFEVRVLNSEEFVFVHIPPAAAVFKIGTDGLSEVTELADAEKAAASFRKPRRRTGGTGRASRAVEMPDHLKSALSSIPAGYKLGYDKDGQPKLVKSRKRRSSK